MDGVTILQHVTHDIVSKVGVLCLENCFVKVWVEYFMKRADSLDSMLQENQGETTKITLTIVNRNQQMTVNILAHHKPCYTGNNYNSRADNKGGVQLYHMVLPSQKRFATPFGSN